MASVLSGDRQLYQLDTEEAEASGTRRMLHTEGFRFLDRAALVEPADVLTEQQVVRNPWRLCTVTQVEEVKCVLRLLPIWLCTILYSVIFTQMASLFVEQGAVMNTSISGFNIPPASMSAFDILSVAVFIFVYRHFIHPAVCALRKNSRGLTELQRRGIGLVIAITAMISAGTVEIYRIKGVCKGCDQESPSSLSILWQIPQYVLVGASEVFMYVGQLEFFNSQMPDGLKSFGSALCMTSISLGNYVSSLIVTIVMSITATARGGRLGWIPGKLNKGHLDRFYFLLAALTAVDFLVYLVCAKWYKCIKLEEDKSEEEQADELMMMKNP